MLVWKWDTEGFFRLHNFTKVLASSGAILASAAVKIYNIAKPPVEQSGMVSDIAIVTPANLKVKYKIKGGTPETRYTLVVAVKTVDGQDFVDKVRCKVR